MGSVHSVSLNEAIVMSGGCTSGERKMVVGGWVWAWWMISDVQVMTSWAFYSIISIPICYSDIRLFLI